MLKELLENTEDKFSIFQDEDKIFQYNLTVQELLDLIKIYLTDEQIVRLVELEHIRQLQPRIIYDIITLISDYNLTIQFLEKDDILLEVDKYKISDLLISLGDSGIIQILLNNPNIFKKYNITNDLQQIIDSLSEESKLKILHEPSIFEQYKDIKIIEIIKYLNDENKLKILSNKNLIQEKLHIEDISDIINVIKNDDIRENIINIYGLDIESFISKFSVDYILRFIKENNIIYPYKITCSLMPEKQIEFVSKFENMGFTIKQKRQILATLDKETKENIDKSSFPEEYITAINMQEKDSSIIFDFNKDLEVYRDLDELIRIYPQDIPKEKEEKIFELCQICPNIKIYDKISSNMGGFSTIEEYINAEKWIESVLQGINEEWTDIQKIAYIDNAIGKKISYTPDFDTEVCNEAEARALWKIIDSGYGVCNGIAQIEQYILKEVGIEAELVSSGHHVFLKLKDLEFMNTDGKIVKGNTILDPTWNLTAHRYGGKPKDFCRSYEEIRKHDIREDDKEDLKCHKNDEILADCTLDLPEQVLRQIFISIGIADKEGKFPITDLINKSDIIYSYKLPAEQLIKKQFLLLQEYYPEFAKCQNSTIEVISNILLNDERLRFKKCVVNRVYDKEDKEKRPVLYVYINLPEIGNKFYFADKQIGEFVELSQKQFEEKFECYEMDIKEQDGHRPWEDIETEGKLENLARSSGKIVGSER